MTDTLIDTVYSDTGGPFSAKDIKRATHRYYESRRRLGIEEMPDRQVSPVLITCFSNEFENNICVGESCCAEKEEEVSS